MEQLDDVCDFIAHAHHLTREDDGLSSGMAMWER